jgi:hypothetical protein
MLFKEIICIFSGNHTKLVNIFRGENAELFIVKAAAADGRH